MSSIRSFELSMLTVGSAMILFLLLISIVVYRTFFVPTKSPSGQSNVNKQPVKSKTVKRKKNSSGKTKSSLVHSLPVEVQREESDDRKPVLIISSKQLTIQNKALMETNSTDDSNVETNNDENSHSNIKSTQATQTDIFERTETNINIEVKSEALNVLNTIAIETKVASISTNQTKLSQRKTSKKKTTIKNDQLQRTSTENADKNDGEEWFTVNNKQIAYRNRKKAKNINSNVDEKTCSFQGKFSTSVDTDSSLNQSQSTVKEICTESQKTLRVDQQISTRADCQQDNDQWWKQQLDGTQIFSVADICEWSEWQNDEQNTIQVNKPNANCRGKQ